MSTPATRRKRIAQLRNSRMTVFLVLLVLTIFVVPVIAPPFDEAGRAVVEGFFALVLLAGVWVVIDERAIAAVVALLFACMAAFAWLSAGHVQLATPVMRAGRGAAGDDSACGRRRQARIRRRPDHDGSDHGGGRALSDAGDHLGDRV